MSDEMFPDARRTIAAIAELEPHERPEKVNEFLRSQMTLCRDLAMRSLRHHVMGSRDSEVVNDAMQVYLMVASSLLLQEINEPGSISDLPHRWEAVLSRRGATEVREMLDRANVDDSPTDQRRARYLRMRQVELRANLGREPEPAELAEYANQTASANRKDPSRQSLVFTAADAKALIFAPGSHSAPRPQSQGTLDTRSVAHLRAEAFTDEDMSSDFVLTRMESPEFVRMVVEKAKEVSPTCGAVASVWFGEYLSTSPDRRVLEVAEVAAKLGITSRQVNVQQARVRTIAIEVLADEYGIGASDVA